MPYRHRTIAALVAVALHVPHAAVAGLSDVFRDERFVRLGLAPLAPALADTVASTYPVASASSAIEFVYDRRLDAVVRRPGPLGPIFGERAETVGPGRFDITLSYSFVELATINDAPLDGLMSRPIVHGRLLFFPVPGGIKLRDGRLTSILPVRVALDVGVTAHVLTPSLTYGVTRDLDVNVSLPLLHTALEVRTRTRVPDPRFPEFALPIGDPAVGTVSEGVSAASDGVGDLLLRGKYILHRGEPIEMAAALGISLPTGDRDDFQGTGRTRVQPSLIASRRLWRLELLANAGADLNADDIERTVLRWAVGGTASIVESLTVAVVFLGRHELARQTDPISFPFFFQIERNDVYDASMGMRWRFAESAVVSANALVPMNREGLRPDAIPTVQLEYTF